MLTPFIGNRTLSLADMHRYSVLVLYNLVHMRYLGEMACGSLWICGRDHYNLGSWSAWKMNHECSRGSYSVSFSAGQQITAYMPRAICSYQQLLSINWGSLRGKCLFCPGNRAKNQFKCPTG